MKRIYRVTFNEICPKTGQPRFINFECRAPSVEALTTMLNDGQIVVGASLFTVRHSAATWRILSRRAASITKAGVTMIEEPRWRFVETEAAAA